MKNSFLFIFLIMFFCGGLYSQNYPHRNDFLWITTPDSPNWLYNLNQEAAIEVSLYRFGIQQNNIEIEYAIAKELMPVHFKGKTTLINGKANIAMGTMSEPGFLDCNLTVTIEGVKSQHHIKVGFEPEKLIPYTQFPDDFISFWDNAIADAAKCPVEVSSVFVPEYSSDNVDCYLVKIQVYKRGQYVYGYLTMPKVNGKYPVVISPPGAGVKPMDPLKDIFYAENGFIRFDMEIHGIRPNLDADTYAEISRAFSSVNNSYLVNGLDNKENYYLKKVYLSFNRVIDYLSTLPQWDGKNIIAQGGSQGGALAIVATALDSRITACAATHPAFADMAAYKANRAGGYPHFFTRFQGMDTPEKINTMQYYDVVNFAKLIKVPVFMTWGFNDNVTPATTSYVTYNVLNTNKEALITPVNEHWISDATRHSIMKWIKGQLK